MTAGLAAGWKTKQPRGETAQARCDHSLLPITRQELCGPDRHRRSPAERLNNDPATRAWVTVIDDDMTCAVGTQMRSRLTAKVSGWLKASPLERRVRPEGQKGAP